MLDCPHGHLLGCPCHLQQQTHPAAMTLACFCAAALHHRNPQQHRCLQPHLAAAPWFCVLLLSRGVRLCRLRARQLMF
jgi:hypothetical protein